LVAFRHLKRVILVLFLGFSLIEVMYRICRLKYHLWRYPPRKMGDAEHALFYRVAETFGLIDKPPNARVDRHAQTGVEQ